tara:strand:- start:55 stop:534 length:480 start_codon:yes stop_codon:yes gene_type:complete
MNNSYPICDYVTVFPVIGDIDSGNTSRINIQAAQYNSTSKADYCLVSLADASLDRSAEEEPVAVILVNPAPQNNQSAHPVIGHLSIQATSGSTVYHHSFVPNGVKYLVPARPSQIAFRGLTTETQTAVGFTGGYLTFKFEYLSKEQVFALNEQTNYMTF